MIGLLKNKSQYYTDFFFRDGVQCQEFLLFTQELFHFTQEILHLLSKKLQTPYSRNLRIPTYSECKFTQEPLRKGTAIFTGYL